LKALERQPTLAAMASRMQRGPIRDVMRENEIIWSENVGYRSMACTPDWVSLIGPRRKGDRLDSVLQTVQVVCQGLVLSIAIDGATRNV
jgi:hypothetical protein